MPLQRKKPSKILVTLERVAASKRSKTAGLKHKII